MRRMTKYLVGRARGVIQGHACHAACPFVRDSVVSILPGFFKDRRHEFRQARVTADHKLRDTFLRFFMEANHTTKHLSLNGDGVLGSLGNDVPGSCAPEQGEENM